MLREKQISPEHAFQLSRAGNTGVEHRFTRAQQDRLKRGVTLFSEIDPNIQHALLRNEQLNQIARYENKLVGVIKYRSGAAGGTCDVVEIIDGELDQEIKTVNISECDMLIKREHVEFGKNVPYGLLKKMLEAKSHYLGGLISYENFYEHVSRLTKELQVARFDDSEESQAIKTELELLLDTLWELWGNDTAKAA